MKTRSCKRPAGRKYEKGMSAVELLIAMAIFLIVMSSVYGILKIGNLSRTTVNSRSENIKNVRLAINSIGREAVNAGLGYNRIGGTVPDDFTFDNFKLPADADKDPDLLTAISSGDNISESDYSKNGEKNDVVAFAFRDFQFNDGFPIVINDVTESDGKLILKTPDGACANCRPYDLFLVETGEGKQALILSTDIVNNNQIVLGGGSADPLNINYGKGSDTGGGGGVGGGVGGGRGTPKQIEDARKDVEDALKRVADAQEDLDYAILKNDLKKIADETKKLNEELARLKKAQDALNALMGGGSTSGTSGSAVKKCVAGETKNCINYGSTTVVVKKIYLVSYSVGADGTLMRTTYGNNTGATADEQIFKQPIANGVRSFKLQYLLSDGTVTEDPSVANTQKERCNDIVQIEVTATVESETSLMGVMTSDPIVLTSTFSTRNLKYDVY